MQRRNQVIPGDTKTEKLTISNLWDAAKAVLRGKFIAIQSYHKKRRKISSKQLTYHVK